MPKNPWYWIPSVYLAEGLPYAVVMTLSVVMYKKLGVANTDIALYTSWLYLPWVLKPLWSPVVDMLQTKRAWVVATQGLLAVAFIMTALAIPSARFLEYTIIILFIAALVSATHDIAVDGLYMLSLSSEKQAWFIGVRNTFYRLALIAGQGLLVMLAGILESSGDIPGAWSKVFFVLAAVFALFSVYHFAALPRPVSDVASKTSGAMNDFFRTFALFFKKPGIGATIFFLLIYRFGEAQLVKIAAPFLLDARDSGGLGLTTAQAGFTYGTVGVMALMAGGLTGGFAAARGGLQRWLWPMFFAINLPHALYLFLALAQPENLYVINLCVAGEQAGYGFGFTAYVLFMIRAAEGEYKTSHYAIATGFMAMGMMLPGMPAGWLQEKMGYAPFFAWILFTMIPAAFAVKLAASAISVERGGATVT